MKIKCVAIDDEPLAIDIITEYIQKHPQLELQKCFTNCVEALSYLESKTTDILFVDIQMHDMTGFELLEKLQNKPLVIFTTAYGEYALKGFKFDAIDYLLKPIDYPDFEKAVSKAISWYNTKTDVKSNKDFLFIKSEYKIIRLNFADIEYIQGMSEYVKIVTSHSKPVMSLISLKTLEEQLPSDKFMRVHKSFIVNLDKVNIVERGEIYYNNGTVIPVSAQYKEKFNQFLETNFLL